MITCYCKEYGGPQRVEEHIPYKFKPSRRPTDSVDSTGPTHPTSRPQFVPKTHPKHKEPQKILAEACGCLWASPEVGSRWACSRSTPLPLWGVDPGGLYQVDTQGEGTTGGSLRSLHASNHTHMTSWQVWECPDDLESSRG